MFVRVVFVPPPHGVVEVLLGPTALSSNPTGLLGHSASFLSLKQKRDAAIPTLPQMLSTRIGSNFKITLNFSVESLNLSIVLYRLQLDIYCIVPDLQIFCKP